MPHLKKSIRLLLILFIVFIIPVLDAASGQPWCLLRMRQYMSDPCPCYQFNLAPSSPSGSGQRAIASGGICTITDLGRREGWEGDPTFPFPFADLTIGDKAMGNVSPYFDDFYGCNACRTGTKKSNNTGNATNKTHGGVIIENSIILLFDASGSMADNNKIENAKIAAKNFISSLGDADQVALIVFYDCSSIVIEQPFTFDKSVFAAKIDAISPSSATPLYAAISFAKDYMNKNAEGLNKKIIQFTDGEETCGGVP